MTKNKLVAPVLKWVGGKRQLLRVLTPATKRGEVDDVVVINYERSAKKLK